MILSSSFHSPVLLPEVISTLEPISGNKYIDATIGGGGYTKEILKKGGGVLGIDLDPEAIKHVSKVYKSWDTKYILGKDLFLTQGNYKNIDQIAKKYKFEKVAGIIYDLGLSTYQLERSNRGFSYKRDDQLDMRFFPGQKLTAKKIINSYSEEKIYEIISEYSEEINSRAIAAAIFRARTLRGPIVRVKQLVSVVDNILKKIYSGRNNYEYKKIRERTLARVFQSLRIAVNDELSNLLNSLKKAIYLLSPKGKVIVISYHSLEDRIVKLIYKEAQKKALITIVNKKPIMAAREEILTNSKAKSAKMRIAEKI